MTAKKNKSKSSFQPLDLDNCQVLQHLQEIPKSRSASITSMSSEEGEETTVLLPPPVREFDDLTAFESFVRDETWDNEFDYFDAKLSYVPPFVLKECHDNLEKVKPTMNKNSKKFKRNLQHHIKNHLIKDLQKCCGYPLDLHKMDTIETPKKVTWKFMDDTDHGFTKEEEDRYNRHWKLELEISCNNENPTVEVNYRSVPV